ncbi:MAG: Trk system potassium transporter TrkA [Chlamydiae bacterium CG10_big_fil_rev_8_21_14_0_10_42_34]|nr:MAG: Trk system potassium transporter TrkA [Chlamydiae bacterium CG10_big_fil_rev_8_21_14_0_10_42_34]
MNIVILGAGKTGSYVASTLSDEEHNVTLIDQDVKALERIGRESDVATIQATAPNWKLFEDLAENKPDLFFAATGDDEANLVACSIAKNLGFSKTIARVQKREYLNHSRLDFRRLFFVDYFIGPEILAAQDLCKMLVHSGDLAVEHFAHGAIQMRTIQIPDLWKFGETPICKLDLPPDLIAGLIRRKNKDEDQILIPHGNDFILPGDQVTLVGEAKVMHHLHEIFHAPKLPVRSVILVGGSSVAVHLAHFLSQQKIDVRIIEKKLPRCEILAELLPFATIIHRDGRDPQLLRSERIQDADALVSCTHFDETNLLIASLAKQLGCKKAIAQITNGGLLPILEKVGVTAALSARVNVTNRILSILDEGTTLSVASLSSDAAKIIELKVSTSSKAIGIPLTDLDLPKGLLIAVIESQGRVMVGRGSRVLCPDDIVIAICNPVQIPHLQQLFH